MPYETIEDLPADVKQLPGGGQKTFLATFNSAYSGTCKNKGGSREECSFSIAWDAIKRQFQKDGNKWVKKDGAGEETVSSPTTEYELVGAANSPVVLEGPLVQIGARNGNGWGIPAAEVENTIRTLKGAPLKICSGEAAITDEHSCDYNWDPKAEIGTIEAAYEKDGWIHARAPVTDKTAAAKIRDGTWKRRWSVFGAGTPQPDGMRTNFRALSITLVKRPAYPDAGYKVSAAGGNNTANEYSEDDINKMLDWMKANPNKITEAHKRMMYDIQNAKDRQQWMKDMLGEMEKNPGMIDDDMRTKMRDMMKVSAGASLSKNTMEETMAEGTEKIYTQADLDKAVAAAREAGRLETEKLVAAAAQDALKGMMPRAEAEKLIAASVEQAKTGTLEQIKKENLIGDIAQLQVGAGMIKPEESEVLKKALAVKSAASLEEDKALLTRVKGALETAGAAAVNKFKETQLPASGNQKSQGAAVGSFDPVKREWR